MFDSPFFITNAEKFAYQQLADFTFFQVKLEGTHAGGFYYDSHQDGWLLKSYSHNPLQAVNEYLSGALFQLLLGENAPQTALIIDETQGDFLLGSKLLDNFQTLSALSNPNSYSQWGEEFPMLFNGKPIQGFTDGLCAVLFLGECDPNASNVGLIAHEDYYTFAKIDHGLSLHFQQQTFSLDDFRYHLIDYYQIDSLEMLGFDALYQSINRIIELDFTLIEEIVNDKINIVQHYLETLSFKEPFISVDELKDYQAQTLSHLHQQQQRFQIVADKMALEKSIIDHDVENLSKLLAKGIDLAQTFQPFYQPLLLDNEQTQAVTGLGLIHQHWPLLTQVLDDSSDLIVNNSFSKPDLAVEPSEIISLKQENLELAQVVILMEMI